MWWVVVVIFLCCMLLSVGTFTLQYLGYCPSAPGLPGVWSEARFAARGVPPPPVKEDGLPADVVARLKSYSVAAHAPLEVAKAGKEAEEEDECLICQEALSTRRVAQLSCGHIFHKEPCIRDWLLRKASCPICRAAVTEESLRHSKLAPTSAPDIELGMTKPGSRQNKTDSYPAQNPLAATHLNSDCHGPGS